MKPEEMKKHIENLNKMEVYHGTNQVTKAAALIIGNGLLLLNQTLQEILTEIKKEKGE